MYEASVILKSVHNVSTSECWPCERTSTVIMLCNVLVFNDVLVKRDGFLLGLLTPVLLLSALRAEA